MASSLALISPHQLRSDLYCISSQDEHTTPLVISVLASLLERTMARNQRFAGKCTWIVPEFNGYQIFQCHQTPDMTIQSFLERIFRYTRFSPSVFVVAYVYIDRLCQFHPRFQISASNVHRLLITALMVASKFVEDSNYRNSYYARIGGLRTKEMNGLEVEFLFLMQFKLQVSVRVFESYCCHLEREVGVGGGYQIERTLKSMCSGEIIISSKTKQQTREQTRVIGCSSH